MPLALPVFFVTAVARKNCSRGDFRGLGHREGDPQHRQLQCPVEGLAFYSSIAQGVSEQLSAYRLEDCFGKQAIDSEGIGTWTTTFGA